MTGNERRASVLFLAPHNDDETLFGSFSLLREKPHVVICLRSTVQELRGTGVTYTQREAETQEAMDVLGVRSWEQWSFPDSDPPWDEIERELGQWVVERVYAPAWEAGGHEHHNELAEVVERVFPPEKLTRYLTYTTAGRSSSGAEVAFEPEWVLLKLHALACYRSQIVVPETWTTGHFVGDQREYYAVTPPRPTARARQVIQRLILPG
jgi:LmbE family N-acetylglucosaminyl deacetylase